MQSFHSHRFPSAGHQLIVHRAHLTLPQPTDRNDSVEPPRRKKQKYDKTPAYIKHIDHHPLSTELQVTLPFATAGAKGVHQQLLQHLSGILHTIHEQQPATSVPLTAVYSTYSASLTSLAGLLHPSVLRLVRQPLYSLTLLSTSASLTQSPLSFCIADHHLTLSVDAPTYHRLGLVGHLSSLPDTSCATNELRYNITIDLRDLALRDSTKLYQRTITCLRRIDTAFEVAVYATHVQSGRTVDIQHALSAVDELTAWQSHTFDAIVHTLDNVVQPNARLVYQLHRIAERIDASSLESATSAESEKPALVPGDATASDVSPPLRDQLYLQSSLLHDFYHYIGTLTLAGRLDLPLLEPPVFAASTSEYESGVLTSVSQLWSDDFVSQCEAVNGAGVCQWSVGESDGCSRLIPSSLIKQLLHHCHQYQLSQPSQCPWVALTVHSHSLATRSGTSSASEHDVDLELQSSMYDVGGGFHSYTIVTFADGSYLLYIDANRMADTH